MLGALFAFTRQHGVDDKLLKFVFAHGLVELSLICIAGAAGAAIGESLIRPGPEGRRESLQRCVARMGRLMLLCCALLVVTGLIEGYVSPDDSYPAWSRAVIGFGWLVVMVTAFNGRLWGRGRLHAPA
jgi:uncharacterized membrane protein SpoIIM required for sporulation